MCVVNNELYLNTSIKEITRTLCLQVFLVEDLCEITKDAYEIQRSVASQVVCLLADAHGF